MPMARINDIDSSKSSLPLKEESQENLEYDSDSSLSVSLFILATWCQESKNKERERTSLTYYY